MSIVNDHFCNESLIKMQTINLIKYKKNVHLEDQEQNEKTQ